MPTYKINFLALGLAFGTVWGTGTLLMGLLAHYFLSQVTYIFTTVGAAYIAQNAPISIVIISAINSFILAFICGVLIGWLYNKFSGCYRKNTK